MALEHVGATTIEDRWNVIIPKSRIRGPYVRFCESSGEQSPGLLDGLYAARVFGQLWGMQADEQKQQQRTRSD